MTVHLWAPSGARCGIRTRAMLTTRDMGKVTCSACQEVSK